MFIILFTHQTFSTNYYCNSTRFTVYTIQYGQRYIYNTVLYIFYIKYGYKLPTECALFVGHYESRGTGRRILYILFSLWSVNIRNLMAVELNV